MQILIPLLLIVLALLYFQYVGSILISIQKNKKNSPRNPRSYDDYNDEPEKPKPELKPQPSLLISLDEHKSPITYYSTNDPKYESIFESVIGSSKTKLDWERENPNKLKEKLVSIGRSDLKKYKRQLIIAMKSDSSNSKNTITAMFNTYPYHAAPLALNTATNIALRALKPSANSRIQVTSHPWLRPKKMSSSSRSGNLSSRQNQYGSSFPFNSTSQMCEDLNPFELNIVNTGSFIFTLAFMLFTSFFIVGPIEEKITNVKQLQLMTGLQPVFFWGSHFVWDYTLYFLVVIITLVLVAIFELSGIQFLSVVHGAGALFLILMCYGFSSIALAYLLSLRSSSVAGGFALLVLIHLLFGTVMGFPLASYSDVGPPPTTIPGALFVRLLYYLLLVPVRIIAYSFPDLAALTAMFRYSNIAAANMICYYQNIENVRLNKTDQKIYISYLKWSRTKVVEGSSYGRNVEVTIVGVGQELFFLVLVGVVYVTWLMLSEYKVCRRICGRETPPPFPPNIYDDDVYQEANRVNYLVQSGMAFSDFTSKILPKCML